MCSFNKSYLKGLKSDQFKATFGFQEVRSCLTVEKVSFMCYRVTEWPRLAGPFGGCLVQAPLLVQAQPEQAAWGLLQADFDVSKIEMSQLFWETSASV